MQGNPVLRALKDAWITLESLGTPQAVMGGLALAVWQHVRATQDVDLLVLVDEAKLDDLLGRLQRAGFRPKRKPPVMPLGDVRLLQLEYQPPGTFLDLQIDLLMADSEYHRAALSRRVPTRLPGLDIEIAVLTCEDLILHKLLAGRILDRADCVALVRANRPSLDAKLLHTWTNRLGLASEFAEVWKEAFPGEATPSG